MKRIILSIILFTTSFYLLAQNNAPTSLSWQGVFRDGDMVMKNEVIDKMIFTVIEDLTNCDGNGNTAYQEEHTNVTTNEYGLLNLLIGEGTTTSSGNWEDLKWGVNCHFLKIEAVVTGTLVNLGMSKITGAPYDSNNYWIKSDNVEDIYYSNGNIGINTSEPTHNLHIIGNLNIQDSDNSPNYAVQLSDNTGERRAEFQHNYSSNPSSSSLDIDIYPMSPDGIAAYRFFRPTSTTGAKFVQFFNGVNPLNPSLSAEIGVDGRNSFFQLDGGNFGLGTNSPSAKLDIKGGAKIGRPSNSSPNFEDHLVVFSDANIPFEGGLLITNTDGTSDARAYKISASYSNNVSQHSLKIGEVLQDSPNEFVTEYINLRAGNVGIGTTFPNEKLHVEGTTRTCDLKITGGCDIGEELNSIQSLEAGDIVIIDENNPGNIVRTDNSYDRKVAGIISGANNVRPGIMLSQKDVFEGEFPLAMLGRVYVKVDGKVTIGDMITTSKKPGFGKAVKDFSKANGAVVGKAMTANKDGEGMVLILVNLQ